MRILMLVLTFVLISCSHLVRGPASVEEIFVAGGISFSHSEVILIPPHKEQEHVFLIKLKSEENLAVDIEEREIRVYHFEKELAALVERVASGQYTIVIHQDVPIKEVVVKVQGRKILSKNTAILTRPSRAHSSIRVIDQNFHEIVFHLNLRDKNGKVFDVHSSPEVIVDNGLIDVQGLKEILKGTWEFRIIYPEQNHVFYFSVRANGLYLEKLLRFQYVEKSE